MSLTVEMELPDPVPVEGLAVGVDVGLHHFATVVGDDGTVAKIGAPRPLQRTLRLLRRRQRQHSRKKKGSKNRRKSALRVARVHRRVRNIRRDFLHKLTTHLAKSKSVIVVEDLHVSGLLQNPHLARTISDVAWEIGYAAGVVITTVEYTPEQIGQTPLRLSPFVRAIEEEGVPV